MSASRGFFATCGSLVISCEVMALSPLGNLHHPTSPWVLGGNSSSTVDGPGDDPLFEGVLDDLLERLTVRRDAVGQRVPACDRHDPPVQIVDAGRVLDLTALEAPDVEALGLGERVEEIWRQIRMRVEQLRP